MSFEELFRDYEARRAQALGMGGEEKLEQRRNAGFLNARERIDRLVDAESFMETGLFATSFRPEDKAKTPADGKITGYGRIDGRDVAVISNDFTVKGASSSLTNSRKIAHMKRVSVQRGLPLILLGESSGARMPDTMGAAGMGALLGNDPTQYQRTRETPWCSAVLGYCYGSSTWYTCMSDFRVMRRDAVMAVSSPRLVSMAIGEKVDPEKLGGYKVHSEVTGLIDRVVDSDEEALDEIRTFLSYMPAHHNEPPPRRPEPADTDRPVSKLLDLLPESRKRVYDVRGIVRAIADSDSVFEMKPRFGRVAVTALARIGGRVVGVIANNPLVKGGALDTQACEKITEFLVLCDSFNIPIVMLVDTPGFSIGYEAEQNRAPSKIINFMNALSLCTVPKFSILLRKSYGQAYLNMGGGRNSDEFAAWPTAEVSFMDKAFAVNIVYGEEGGRMERDDPALFEEKLPEMDYDSRPWDIAGSYAMQAVIRPEETRAYLKRLLEVHELRLTGGVGQHLMRAWPTGY